MRILFLGTSPFAVPTLQALLSSSHALVGIFTQPDRPKGRSRPLSPSAVKQAAPASVPLHQPPTLKDLQVQETVKQLRPDCAVVVAYGQLLPPEFLPLFPKGAYNLHPSLLPKYRGAAPIQWALIHGETETGLTLFQMDEQLDHGPLLLQRELPIHPEEDAVSLSDRLSQLGADFVLEGLSLLEREENPTLTPQTDSAATPAPRLTKKDGLIRWNQPCRSIYNLVRGVQPWPGALTRWKNKEIKIHRTTPDPSRRSELPPGSAVQADPSVGLWVQTRQGQIRIDRLQLAGGKALAASEFLRGHPLSRGECFEPVSA